MHPALNIAINAAREAADIIMRYSERLDRVLIQQKAKHNYFSEVDVKAEAVIMKIISKSYPEHGFIAEESGNKNADAEYVWLIDPLDGTTNYLHSYPYYCVSIALKHKDKIECGVVFDPIKKEFFTASRGQGARLNDMRLRISTQKNDLSSALIGTNFSFKKSIDAQKTDFFQHVVNESAGVRKAGAAALELAYVAAGRIDAFIGFNLCPWDMAAALLIIQEAGGMVSDLYGNDDPLKHGDIVAANPKIFKEITSLHAEI